MKPAPCEKCGAAYHQSYDDGLVECVARLVEQRDDATEEVTRLTRERDEARAALIRAQEDHRAAVEALETYEQRIGDIAVHVLGLVPPDVPSIVKLDAIERRCVEERIAARQAEAERDEAGQRAENAALRAVVARLGEWTHEFGAALKPKGADTFGEGVRECKAQVARILAALPGGVRRYTNV